MPVTTFHIIDSSVNSPARSRSAVQANEVSSSPQWQRLQELAPDNPFLTSEYALSRQGLGEALVMLGQGPQLCPAFLKRGRLSAFLDIPSLPFPPSAHFVSELAGFCRSQRIFEVAINTYASPALKIPGLPREIERRARTEYLFVLRAPTSQWQIGETHRRHINRATKSGVSIRRARSEGLKDHLALCQASLTRREDRGESVPLGGDSTGVSSLVLQGAGELFQAVQGQTVLSSMLVLRSRTGAYYHSAGTNKEGMAIGASHFLVHSVARILQQEGIEVFNLGGADPSLQGLQAFKMRFGTVPVETEAVRAVLCSNAHRVFVESCHALRRMRFW